jgi:hypothetical protein
MKKLPVLISNWLCGGYTIMIIGMLCLPHVIEGKNLVKYIKKIHSTENVDGNKFADIFLKSKTTKSLHKILVDVSALDFENVNIELGYKKNISLKRIKKEGHTVILSSTENEMDGVILIVNGENITGTIKYDNSTYSIEPTGKNREHLLVEQDMTIIRTMHD